ncbi:MAG: DEAD/DEAH box helicase [Methylotenera sp.]|nr:DEAD/DEAH box helicase [Oligoflexia bacterium]
MEEKPPIDSLVTPSSSPAAVTAELAPNPRWDSLGLSPEALLLIEKAGFKTPSGVQAEGIPIALEGTDLIASAQTGTGKTAAFVLPMVDRFAGREGTFGLILAPTRELAQQTQATLEMFGAPRKVRSVVLIGGIDMKIDVAALGTYPQVIIATPGRLCDHLDRGNIWLDYIEVVVLDEADRMLDMGFADQLARIMQDVPAKRQTLLFSATMATSVTNLAKKILKNPKTVAIGKLNSASTSVTQRLLHMPEESKTRELRRLLREEPGSIIVFTRSKDKATRVWRSLHSAGIYDATYIHSDRMQSHREQALAEFKEGKYRIMIATDVAGRGIHVDGIAHVVNYDLPMDPEDYVHRIGRTGRADLSGKATSFVTPQDRKILGEIHKILGKEIPAEYAEASPSASSGDGESSGRSHRGGSRSGEGSSRNGSSRGGRGGAPRKFEDGAQPRAAGASPAPGTPSTGIRPRAAGAAQTSAPISADPTSPRGDGSSRLDRPAKNESKGEGRPEKKTSAKKADHQPPAQPNPRTFYKTAPVDGGAPAPSNGGSNGSSKSTADGTSQSATAAKPAGTSAHAAKKHTQTANASKSKKPGMLKSLISKIFS